ncbi:MAG TPA: SUMF1/EgtB/PvdO family nonheme iron enzyme [Puia sp.]|nr:SUMF1/EgtB/PvdO family nonheme iron enzyme [Puia sp.]
MRQIIMKYSACVLFFHICISVSAQKADTSFHTYEQKIPNSPISFKMIAIPAGSFVMGSNESEKGRRDDEGSATKVAVDAFWMEEHEVTYDEYILFQDETKDPSPVPDGITRPSPPYIDFTLGMGKTGGFPANSMSQYAAITYCKWLYKKTGVFYRLPTEAEWEYACRAGSSTTYFFGNDESQLKKYAWYKENSDNKYRLVKQLQPNAWGLYDMLGNVAEWTLDQYQPDYYAQIKNNTNNPMLFPSTKYQITLRGGSFRDETTGVRCAVRIPSEKKWNARDPQIPRSKWWNTDAPFIGFRIMRPLKQPTSEEVQHFFEQFSNLK